MTSADQLRAAAGKIRETAKATTQGEEEPWFVVRPGACVTVWDGFVAAYEEDAPHIALWSPPVALAVADLLDDVAADKDSGLTAIHPRLLDLADLILGGQS
jgi:uncharacterized membrane protein